MTLRGVGGFHSLGQLTTLFVRFFLHPSLRIWHIEHPYPDCLVNMVTMFLSVVHQSPWFIGWPRWMCQTYAFTQQSLITWNRLLPVGCCCILNQYFLFILFNINIMKKSQTRENLIKLQEIIESIICSNTEYKCIFKLDFY